MTQILTRMIGDITMTRADFDGVVEYITFGPSGVEVVRRGAVDYSGQTYHPTLPGYPVSTLFPRVAMASFAQADARWHGEPEHKCEHCGARASIARPGQGEGGMGRPDTALYCQDCDMCHGG